MKPTSVMKLIQQVSKENSISVRNEFVLWKVWLLYVSFICPHFAFLTHAFEDLIQMYMIC